MIRIPDPLDEDFPLGDGVADTHAVGNCPYCGAPVDVAVDPGGGRVQRYVEDCPVCCRPWTVRVLFDDAGNAAMHLGTEDEP